MLTVGSSDDVIHDWNYLFGHLGLLAHDTQIAGAMRVIAWLGNAQGIVALVCAARSGENEPSTSGQRLEMSPRATNRYFTNKDLAALFIGRQL